MKITARPTPGLAHYHDVLVDGQPRGSIYRHRSLWVVALYGQPGGWDAPRFFSFREARAHAAKALQGAPA